MATFDPAQFDRAMQLAPQKLYDRLRVHLDEYMHGFATRTMASQAKQQLRVRSAALWRSFRSSRSGSNLNNARWSVYTTSKYAAIHETGGEIKPTVRQWLTVPISSTYETKTGRTRSGALFVESKTFFAWSGGDLYMFRRTGKKRPKGWRKIKAKNPDARDPSVQAIFKLVKSVKIKPRLGFLMAWKDQRELFLGRVMKAVDEALDGLGGSNAQPQ